MRVVAKIGTASITDDRGAIDGRRGRQALRRGRRAARRRPRGDRGVVGGGRRRRRRARDGRASDRHADAAGDLGGRAESTRRGLQPRTGPPRPRRRAGAARSARLRRPHAVPARSAARSSGCSNWAASRSSTRTTRSRTTSCATATTTVWPRCWRTASAPTCWCCSPTWTACTPPIPRRDPSATLIPLVRVGDPLLAVRADAGGSGRGSGGMASKLTAARMASWSGMRSVIARASRPDVLAGRGVGRTGRHDLRGARPGAVGAQAVDRVRVGGDGRRRGRRRRRAGADRPAEQPAPRWRGRRAGRVRRGRHRRHRRAPTAGRSPAGWLRSTPTSLVAVVGLRTRRPPDGVNHEVVHRDDLVVLPT